jgi:sRNA-binding protein
LARFKIHKQVLEAAGDAIDSVVLGRFMHWWVRKWDYLDAIAHGEARRNLDGSPAGEPDEPQRREAARQVYGARAEVVLARIAARLEKATGQLISAA